MGQVCRKHEEFYEEACRWCEPAPAVVKAPLVGLEMAVPLPAQMAAAQQNIASGSLYGLGALPPVCYCGKFLAPTIDYWYRGFNGVLHTQARCAP